MNFIEYVKVNLLAKIALIIIPVCIFCLPDEYSSGAFSFIRLAAFVYCLLWAIRLFALQTKDQLVSVAYMALAVYIQPFYKFFDTYTINKVHGISKEVFNGNYYPLQHCGEVMIALLVLSYIEEVYRRKP